MPAPYSGKCLCGAVSVEIANEPLVVLSCGCDHCQVGAGGVAQVIGKFAEKDIQVSGEENLNTFTFSDTGSGNPKEKMFCKTCGVTMWTIPGAAKGSARMVRTAVLKDGLALKPKNEIYTINRPAWVKPADGANQFEKSSH